MERIFSFDQAGYPFHLFSLSHLLMIGLSFGLVTCLFTFRERIREQYKRPFKYMLVVLLILGELSFHLWYIVHDRWDVQLNLPLQLCSISLYLCTIMLLTKNYKVFEVSFFVSMTGAFIAILTPELFFGFPHMRFIHFFIVHITIVIACFYMVWVEEFKPAFASVIRAFAVLNILAGFVCIINKMIGSNYMFLAEKTSNASILDFLGPYPWYILSLEVLALALFMLIYVALFKSTRNK
ncbi:TIGR02206 family membrane protein [Gracilibacillus caseinilyticus]|uniref:TIGR02206 family membrane protein n=1 Tax=Gracilibacillus caseinilyticus TaxID=2932256 RepID=A0ABY4F4J5_9BACI|nr:TIGR02206 family membrane protein [Gracilibacillus caseinilyticus]UOQ49391.1 TIGR02206 family membrane protein [Gracilibacillus caseinilyticus]